MRPFEEGGPQRGPASQPGTAHERGGVLLRLGEGEDAALGFVSADVARRLTTLSSFTAVPGARPPASGIALADGAVVTVLRAGDAGGRFRVLRGADDHAAPHPPRPGEPPPAGRRAYAPGQDWLVPGADRAVLCNLGGFEVALVGAVVVTTGVFDAAPDGGGVIWRGDVVPLLDVRALYAQAEAATWAERASRAGSAPADLIEDAAGGLRADEQGVEGER